MDDETVRLHGLLNSTRRRWDRAAMMVDAHLAVSATSYVSWSGGKDSTAVAVLAHQVRPDIPIVRSTCGVDFPETVAYCASLATEHGWAYRIAEDMDAADYLSRISAVDEHATANSYEPQVSATLGYIPSGWLYGLRADESPDRAKLLYSRRGAWVSAAGRHVCAPLWDWSRLDVLAFLRDHGVGLNPVYARLAEVGCPDQGQRVGYMVGGGGGAHGRYVWLRRGWPGQWSALAERLPWLASMS